MSIFDRFRRRAAADWRRGMWALDVAAIRRLGEIGVQIAGLAHPELSQRDSAEAALKRKGLKAVDPLVSALDGGIGPLDHDAKQRAARVLRSTLTSERRSLSDRKAAALLQALAPIVRNANLRSELMPVLGRLANQLLQTASAQRYYRGPSDRQMQQAAAALGHLSEADMVELFGVRAAWVRFGVDLRALEVGHGREGFERVLSQLAIATKPTLQIEDMYGGHREVARAEGPSSFGLHSTTRAELAGMLARATRGRRTWIDPVPEQQFARWSESAGTNIVSSRSMEWAGTMPTCLLFRQILVWRVGDDEYLVWGLPRPASAGTSRASPRSSPTRSTAASTSSIARPGSKGDTAASADGTRPPRS